MDEMKNAIDYINIRMNKTRKKICESEVRTLILSSQRKIKKENEKEWISDS